MRAEKFSFLLVCALVIELFIVALVSGGLFYEPVAPPMYQYFAIVISSIVISSSLWEILYFLQALACTASSCQGPAHPAQML